MIRCLGNRVLQPEILDTLPWEEARASLADLVRINQHWGGHSSLRKLVDETIPVDEEFTVLDVGAASGDMGERFRQQRPGAKVTSLDYLESHLRPCAGPRVAGDAFALPFSPRSFDYVFCSQFLHHFSNSDVVRLLAGFAKVARKQVLVLDLLRNPLPYVFIASTRRLLGWHPVSVHDGKISVEAAFRPRELAALAQQAGLANPRVRAFVPAFRIALWAGAV
jgi:2-polyprenyl-3-methyl-5-hydroxy-6-metoxy-1,4-benzoquinol methylase